MNKSTAASDYQPIAVVGLGGVFPGALDTAIFWKNIVSGKEAISEIPPERLVVPAAEVYSEKVAVDKTWSLRAGLVNMKFDGAGLALEAGFLEKLDPLYHYTLTAAREALSQCAEGSINKKKTGVILAAIALPTVGSSRLANRLLGHSIEKKLFAGQAGSSANILDPAELLSAKVTSRPASLLSQAFGLGGGSVDGG